MAEEKVLVSVVVVTYNHEKYIEKALESIIEQDIFDSFEVLVGDDGSKDRTVEILKQYEEKYKNIHVYAHENMGISKNVYDLFCKCKGEYIAVLEGDDYWILPEKVSKQISQIKEHNCLASASNSKIVDDNGNEYGFKNNRKTDIIVGKKEVEKYETALWMPSGLLFKNIFKDSGDKYSVIRDASRMGGNHSGLINLLGSLGTIYLTVDSYCVWRKNDVVPGSNYSSTRHDSVGELYESMKKYCIYHQELGIDHENDIYFCYGRCVDKLKSELKETLGQGAVLKCFTYLLYRKIRYSKFVKIVFSGPKYIYRKFIKREE